VKLPVKPSWWWLGGVGGSGEAFFNKRLFALLWYCWFLLLLSSLLPGRGGVEWGETPTTSCTIRGGSGDPVRLELIHDRGKLASTILCRQGSAISNSSEEAWIRFCCGCSKSLSHEVMRSPWLRDGPWLRIIAGKGLLSNRLWFLGGEAWRTPTKSGGGAQGLLCMNLLCLGVLFVKRKDLSLDRRFPRACVEKGLFCNLYLPLC
jgi:hypothetical protein